MTKEECEKALETIGDGRYGIRKEQKAEGGIRK